VLAALAAWAVYVPATDHYAPTTAGSLNRMNAAAAIGIVVVLYSCIVLAARTLGRLACMPASSALAVAAAVTLALAAGYLARSLGDARQWDAAAADQRREVAGMHRALPSVRRGSTVYVFGAPLAVGPGIPVLGTTLDLTSAMRISYSDPQVVGVPIGASASIACGPRGPLAAGVGASYGDAYMLDIAKRRALRLVDRRQCIAEGGVKAFA
jgi:hypothetical protein